MRGRSTAARVRLALLYYEFPLPIAENSAFPSPSSTDLPASVPGLF